MESGAIEEMLRLAHPAICIRSMKRSGSSRDSFLMDIFISNGILLIWQERNYRFYALIRLEFFQDSVIPMEQNSKTSTLLYHHLRNIEGLLTFIVNLANYLQSIIWVGKCKTQKRLYEFDPFFFYSPLMFKNGQVSSYLFFQ